MYIGHKKWWKEQKQPSNKKLNTFHYNDSRNDIFTANKKKTFFASNEKKKQRSQIIFIPARTER
jgi:hypothetical protein